MKSIVKAAPEKKYRDEITMNEVVNIMATRSRRSTGRLARP